MRFKSGFTLIEMVVGIVVLAVAMTIVTGVFLPQASQTLTPMYQIRATALAKNIMNQILIREFDNVNANTGGFIRCDAATGVVPCTTILGTNGDEKETSPDSFNDVDDFHVYCDDDMSTRQTNLQRFTTEYPGYGLRVCLSYTADKFDGAPADKHIAKLITVTISMPDNDVIALSSFKGNY